MQVANKRRAVKVRRRLRRGAYLLPSLFTTGSIILGFAAVVRGLSGDFHTAAALVIIAGFLDGLDGRLARLIQTESDFGKELDSLADCLTFGSAPALLMYLWGFNDLGRIGWLVPLFFLLCATVRLARFNVQTTIVDPRAFVGLPAPAAAGMIVALLLLISEELAGAPPPRWLEVTMLVAMATVGGLMVSTFRYPSWKKIDLRQRVSYRFALVLAVALLVLVWRPAVFFVTAGLIYVTSGPLTWLVGRLRRRPVEPEAEIKPQESG